MEYTYKTGQFGKWCHELNQYVFFDIVHKMKVIEYHGDYWHMNPKKYKETDYNKKLQKFAKDVWEFDKMKISTLTNEGYEIFVVYDSEYKNNKNIVEEIVDWLKR